MKEINNMTIFAQEIDGTTPSNLAHIERWQGKFGSILNKLKYKKCINCWHIFKDKDKLNYVACFNGRIVCWHNNCKK